MRAKSVLLLSVIINQKEINSYLNLICILQSKVSTKSIGMIKEIIIVANVFLDGIIQPFIFNFLLKDS